MELKPNISYDILKNNYSREFLISQLSYDFELLVKAIKKNIIQINEIDSKLIGRLCSLYKSIELFFNEDDKDIKEFIFIFNVIIGNPEASYKLAETSLDKLSIKEKKKVFNSIASSRPCASSFIYNLFKNVSFDDQKEFCKLLCTYNYCVYLFINMFKQTSDDTEIRKAFFKYIPKTAFNIKNLLKLVPTLTKSEKDVLLKECVSKKTLFKNMCISGYIGKLRKREILLIANAIINTQNHASASIFNKYINLDKYITNKNREKLLSLVIANKLT